ncbi:MAG TPA: hypothetical protein VK655_04390 [Solirubrobacteraceae bacterium]|nr:hypothetical protein [Solirubrobacteraceae bacterium]
MAFVASRARAAPAVRPELIAASAESAGVELLHYDEDFERIAAITGQPTRWIVPRSSL